MASQSQRQFPGTPARTSRSLGLAAVLALCYALLPAYWMAGNIAVLSSSGFAAGLSSLLRVSTAAVVITLLLGAAAAYALGAPRICGHGLRSVVLALVALPQLALIGALYLLFSNPCGAPDGACGEQQLYTTPWPLIIPYVLLTLPLTVLLLAAGLRNLASAPLARADAPSQSPLQIFYRAILPLAVPSVVTAGLLGFIAGWNAFLSAVGFTSASKYRAAPIALSLFGNIGFGVVVALAAALIVSGPLVLLAPALQGRLAAGAAGRARARWLGRLPHAWLELSGAARVLLVVLALSAAVFAAEGWRVLAFPYALDYGEAPLLDQTLRLAHGQSIYRADLQLAPFTIANYPPLYVLAQVPLAWLFGPAFWYGRLLSWLAMIGAALFVGLILRALTGDRLAALVGGLTLLAFPYTRYWAALYRVDALALCLSLAALWVMVRSIPSGSAAKAAGPRASRRPALAIVAVALLLLAAVYTRQSYGLAAPLTAFVWLWMRGLRRAALALAGLVAGLGLGLFLLLNFVTGGGFFFNIVTANVNELKGELLQQYLGELAMFMPIWLAITAVFVLLAARTESWRLLLPYTVGAALSALTIGKVGSNINYLLELCAALSLAAGAAVAWLRHAPRRRYALMLGLALQAFLLLPGLSYQLFSQFRLDSRADMALVGQRIRAADGPVLADEDIGQLVLAGRPLLFQPFELTQLARVGMWDQAPLLDAIERQEYALILIFKFPGLPLDRDRWTDQMRAVINRRYAEVEQIGFTEVYRPR